MKKLWVFTALAAVLVALPAAAPAADKGTTSAIEAVNSEFIAAWNVHDAKKMAAVWAENGDLINPFGQKATGRAGIEKFFEGEQAGPMKGTTYKLESSSIRQLDRETAIADWEGVVTGMMDANGQPQPPFRHHVFGVYVKKGGHWQAAAIRAFAFKAIPEPAAK